MKFVTQEAEKTYARVDTIHWVSHVAMLSYARYREVLTNEETFQAVSPGVDFENQKITHSVGGKGILLTTTKREIVAGHNYDLFKAWQIVLAISAMTSILDYFLKTVAENITKKSYDAKGIFYQFKKETGIRFTDFPKYSRLRHFHEVRNISAHNLGRVNQRFKEKTGEQHHKEGPYVFFPQQVTEYRDLIGDFLGYVESKVTNLSQGSP